MQSSSRSIDTVVCLIAASIELVEYITRGIWAGPSLSRASLKDREIRMKLKFGYMDVGNLRGLHRGLCFRYYRGGDAILILLPHKKTNRKFQGPECR